MPTKKTIMYLGQKCPVLKDEDGVLTIEGPNGQERIRKRKMDAIHMAAERSDNLLVRLGESFEQEGRVYLFASVDLLDDEACQIVLEESINDGKNESPEPLEKLMEDHGLRITKTEPWGYFYEPVPDLA